METPRERKVRKVKAKAKEAEASLEGARKAWEPNTNAKASGDAYKTLFVGRLSYDVTEKKLRREFEQYGAIENLVIVYDKDGQSRG